MSKAWMPLYVADYLADTAHLSATEHGAYLLLIMHYWQHGGLPDDPKRLARIARLTPDEWSNAVAMLRDFFEEGWKHKRIEAELALAAAKYEKRAAAGKKGGNAKASKRLGTKGESSNATAMPEQCSSEALANGCQSQSHISYEIDSSLRSESSSSADEAEREPKLRLEAKGDFPPKAFDETFWPRYPRKVSKDAARRKFEQIRKSGRVSFADLMAGLDRYVANKPVDRDWCHPDTWLNKGRWADEWPAPAAVIETRTTPLVSYSQARRNELNDVIEQMRAERAAKANGTVQ